MKKATRRTVIAAALTTLTGLSHVATAAEGRLSLTTGVDYSTGKYGGTESTDITYIPIVAKYRTGLWAFKLTIPHISITGPGNVIPNVGQVSTGPATRTTESGLGDVVASATYTAYSSRETQTLVDLTGKVKLGTADEKKALGTGKTDYAVQADVYKVMDKFTPFGTVGYKVFGTPANYTLDNVFYGSLGGAYKFTKQTSGGLILDLRQKSSPTGSAHQELTAFVSHRLDKTWKVQGYAVKGFSNGSPSWDVGGMVSYSY